MKRSVEVISQSHACCNAPPAISDNYKEKGQWTIIDGMKTYVTGSPSAKPALLVVYDILGFFPQTLQGADILAFGNSDKKFQVFMPGKFYHCIFFQIGITTNTTATIRFLQWLSRRYFLVSAGY